MKFVLKSLSVEKKGCGIEVHKAGCKDIGKDDPIQVFEIEAKDAKNAIEKDCPNRKVTSPYYRVMPCCNKDLISVK